MARGFLEQLVGTPDQVLFQWPVDFGCGVVAGGWPCLRIKGDIEFTCLRRVLVSSVRVSEKSSVAIQLAMGCMPSWSGGPTARARLILAGQSSVRVFSIAWAA